MTHRSPVVWLAILILALSSTLVTAEFYFAKGSTLVEMAKSEKATFQGYVAGIHDSYSGSEFCLDYGDMDIKQVAAVVKRYVRDLHPEDWHRRGKNIVIDALSESFPCKP